jgi:hypothetical protein
MKLRIRGLFAVGLFLLGIGAAASAWAAPPTPITACPYTITAAGNYAVTQNLTAAGTCISFAAALDGVTIDLQGHTITGSGSGDGIACVLPGFSGSTGAGGCNNLIVANGAVRGFGGGVVLEGNSNTVINIVSEANDGDASAGSGFGFGIVTLGSADLVENSAANGNSAGGIGGAPATVDNCSASNNGGGGISATVVNNSEADGNYLGINANSVFNSTARRNGQGNGVQGGAGGISIGGFGPAIINSTANDNSGFGIQGTGIVLGNTANQNTGAGIALTCPASASGNTAVNNASGDIVPSDATCVLLGNKPPP